MSNVMVTRIEDEGRKGSVYLATQAEIDLLMNTPGINRITPGGRLVEMIEEAGGDPDDCFFLGEGIVSHELVGYVEECIGRKIMEQYAAYASRNKLWDEKQTRDYLEYGIGGPMA